MRRWLVLLVICVLAQPVISTSAATQESVRKDGVTYEVDAFKGTRTISSFATRLPPDNYGSGPQLTMMFSRQTARDSSQALYIFAAYRGPEWMFIPDGETLYFLVDGVPVALSSPDGSTQYRETYRGGVSEISPYPVDEALLLRLHRANSVEVKLSGQRFELRRKFNEDIQKNLRNFLRAIGVADSLLSPAGRPR